MVHQPNLSSGTFQSYVVDSRVRSDNTNYFRVNWDSPDDFPKPSNNCNNVCVAVTDACLCNINIVNTQVFTSVPTVDDITSQLHLGTAEPSILDSFSKVSNVSGVEVWQKNNGGFSQDTIFGITFRGEKTYLKNMRSVVQISGTQSQFRNPPHFVNISVREHRDAVYETDAILETYFHHSNTAPFLALRITQRFGISNPSPRFIETVATAFKDGTYVSNGQTFGTGKYGDLSAMLAAILLDREATTVVLDADPSTGSLKEQIMKVIAFMRAMEFQNRSDGGREIRLDSLQNKIGQEAHSTPSVFNFFLPEYSAPGVIKEASLVSPEAQLLSGPNVINLMNGIISLTDLGLTECFGGFAQRYLWRCGGLAPDSYYDTDDDTYTMGKLTFSPSNPNNAADVVDELSLLLTAGRLNEASRSVIANAYANAGDYSDGLRLAQKLMFSTPEFQSTNVFDAGSELRPDVEFPPPSSKRYKAVIYLKLDGGMDSFSMLAPHSGCSGGKSKWLLEIYKRFMIIIIAFLNSTTHICILLLTYHFANI